MLSVTLIVWELPTEANYCKSPNIKPHTAIVVKLPLYMPEVDTNTENNSSYFD